MDTVWPYSSDEDEGSGGANANAGAVPLFVPGIGNYIEEGVNGDLCLALSPPCDTYRCTGCFACTFENYYPLLASDSDDAILAAAATSVAPASTEPRTRTHTHRQLASGGSGSDTLGYVMRADDGHSTVASLLDRVGPTAESYVDPFGNISFSHSTVAPSEIEGANYRMGDPMNIDDEESSFDTIEVLSNGGFLERVIYETIQEMGDDPGGVAISRLRRDDASASRLPQPRRELWHRANARQAPHFVSTAAVREASAGATSVSTPRDIASDVTAKRRPPFKLSARARARARARAKASVGSRNVMTMLMKRAYAKGAADAEAVVNARRGATDLSPPVPSSKESFAPQQPMAPLSVEPVEPVDTDAEAAAATLDASSAAATATAGSAIYVATTAITGEETPLSLPKKAPRRRRRRRNNSRAAKSLLDVVAIKDTVPACMAVTDEHVLNFTSPYSNKTNDCAEDEEGDEEKVIEDDPEKLTLYAPTVTIQSFACEKGQTDLTRARLAPTRCGSSRYFIVEFERLPIPVKLVCTITPNAECMAKYSPACAWLADEAYFTSGMATSAGCTRPDDTSTYSVILPASPDKPVATFFRLYVTDYSSKNTRIRAKSTKGTTRKGRRANAPGKDESQAQEKRKDKDEDESENGETTTVTTTDDAQRPKLQAQLLAHGSTVSRYRPVNDPSMDAAISVVAVDDANTTDVDGDVVMGDAGAGDRCVSLLKWSFSIADHKYESTNSAKSRRVSGFNVLQRTMRFRSIG